jgi:hypothetical protein
MITLTVSLVAALAWLPVCQDAAPAVEPPTTLEGWGLPDLELPKGVTRKDGFHGASTQAYTFVKDPDLFGALPAPMGTLTQTWSTERRSERPVRGGFAVLQYERGVPQDVIDMLGGLLWGEDGGPTARHPENMAVSGDFLVVLSFKVDDPTGDVLREALHGAAGLTIPRSWAAIQPWLEPVFAAAQSGDGKAGLEAIDAHAEAFEGHAFVQYLAGEFASGLKDWPRAEEAYARAAALHEGGTDLLPGGTPHLWATLDGLGLALVIQRKDARAISPLQRAMDLAEGMGQDGPAAKSGYNLACSLSMTERFEEALTVLARCIEVDPSYAEMARGDSDFEAARERPEFQELLGP